MKKLFFILLLAVGQQINAQEVTVARWLGNARAAVSYTFDDGLMEQYTLAFPELQKRGIHATFYIIGSKVGGDHKGTPCMTWEQIRQLHQSGHEISSHGYRHIGLNKLSGEALRYEIEHNDTLIYNEVGIYPRTYCFPGGQKTSESVTLALQGRIGARMFQTSIGSKRDSLWLSGWLRRLIKNQEWGVGMTHGILVGYDHFTDANIFWQHLDEAASLRNEGKLWIAPLADVAAYQAERYTLQMKVKRKKEKLVVTAKVALDKQLYRQPLTLIIEGTIKEARQDHRPLMVIRREGYSLIDIQPHGGTITIKL